MILQNNSRDCSFPTATQQNFYSISHFAALDSYMATDTVQSLLLTTGNSDWAASDSVVTMLLSVNNIDYTVTVQSLCSHCA